MALNLDVRQQTKPRTNVCRRRGPNDLKALFSEVEDRRRNDQKNVLKITRDSLLEQVEQLQGEELKNVRKRLNLDTIYENLKRRRPRRVIGPTVSYY